MNYNIEFLFFGRLLFCALFRAIVKLKNVETLSKYPDCIGFRDLFDRENENFKSWNTLNKMKMTFLVELNFYALFLGDY